MNRMHSRIGMAVLIAGLGAAPLAWGQGTGPGGGPAMGGMGGPPAKAYRHADDEGGGGLANLSDEQRTRLRQLKAQHLKSVAPLKAQARALKADLYALTLNDKPEQSAIQQKIDALVELKRKLLQEKSNYLRSSREVLTAEQRPAFDIHVMKKVMGEGGTHRRGKGSWGRHGEERGRDGHGDRD